MSGEVSGLFERLCCTAVLTDSQTVILFNLPNNHSLTLCGREKSEKQCCQFVVLSSVAISLFGFIINCATICVFFLDIHIDDRWFAVNE